MTRLTAMMLALLLALLSLSAFAAEETPEASADVTEITALEGYVMEMQDEYLLVKTPDGLYVEAHLTPDTLMAEGVMVGDLIRIAYNGIMTRSLPAQITAMSIDCFMLEGVVGEVREDGFILNPGMEEIFVQADAEMLASIAQGMEVTVYHNGMMTRSIPPMVTAAHLRGQLMAGVVTSMVEGGFVMTMEEEELPVQVMLKEDALLFCQAEPGMEVLVATDGLQTSALDAILVNAVEVLPVPYAQELVETSGIVTEATADHLLITTPDGQTIQVNLVPETFIESASGVINTGDFVHVTYNGQMTFSLPAQIAALKVGCYTHTGTVTEVTPDSFMLITEMEPIVVMLPEGMADTIVEGSTVTVYTNGVMTMSLPAQVNADYVTATVTIAD